MEPQTDIELIFEAPEGLRKARIIAETMIRVYFLNGCNFLPFDDMQPENADGWIHYPSRHVRYEKISAFKNLWTDYKMANLRASRSGAADSTYTEKAEELKRHIKMEGSRFLFSDCSAIEDNRLIENRYFEDFFSMLCLILAAVFPEVRFAGMCRSFNPESYEKKTLTHVTWDGNVLTFEQMEGDPVYATLILSWTRIDNKLMKSSRPFPFIRVDIITDDIDQVEQDEKLNQWVNKVNDVKMEMVSATLRFLHASFPHIMIEAASRKLCEKYRDELLALSAAQGYETKCFSILYEGECFNSDIVVPESVTKIGDKAFKGKAGIKSILIPAAVTEIGEEAFQSCAALEEIVIPDSVREIDSFAFMLCSGLKTVRLPKKLKKLSSGLFSGCPRLENVPIPEGVTEIERFVFSNCTGLKKVVIPDKVRTIGDKAFSGCKSLEWVLIPENVTKFGENVFQNCSKSLTIAGKKGSEAERYAIENGLGFEVIA